MKRVVFIFCILSMLVSGCLDPFDPPVQDYEELLVVEGFINNSFEPQQIKLSLSSPLDTVRFNPVWDANVVVSDELGNQYIFNSAGDGNYYSNPGNFIPEFSRSYMLTVTLSNGKRYVSESVSLKQSPQIDDLYFEPRTFVSGETGSVTEGFVVLVNSNSASNEPMYVRYDFEETFMTVAPFPSFFVYNESANTIDVREDNITECWISRSSTAINIVTTEGKAVNNIREHPIRFLSFEGVELNYRYSILVRQYGMDATAYEFWKNLQQTNESTGTLFDVQPFPLTGNMVSIDDPEEPVLGYFDMASLSEKRIYIDQTDIPAGTGVPTLFSGCNNSSGDTLISEIDVPRFTNLGYFISYYQFPVGYVMVPRTCIDCRIYGSNVKPDFWE